MCVGTCARSEWVAKDKGNGGLPSKKIWTHSPPEGRFFENCPDILENSLKNLVGMPEAVLGNSFQILTTKRARACCVCVSFDTNYLNNLCCVRMCARTPYCKAYLSARREEKVFTRNLLNLTDQGPVGTRENSLSTMSYLTHHHQLSSGTSLPACT